MLEPTIPPPMMTTSAVSMSGLNFNHKGHKGTQRKPYKAGFFGALNPALLPLRLKVDARAWQPRRRADLEGPADFAGRNSGLHCAAGHRRHPRPFAGSAFGSRTQS